MRLLVTPTFARASRRLHRSQKAELDEAVRSIIEHPTIGEAKIGDLAGIRVHKFRMSNQSCLLAYRIVDEDTIKLLTLGSHENFYRDLKRQDE